MEPFTPFLRAVVSYADKPQFTRGVDRLKASLDRFSPTVGRAIYAGSEASGTPPHEVAPYAFRWGAILHARRYLEVAGAPIDVVMWADSSVWAVGPVEPLFQAAEDEEHGALLLHEPGTSVGEWISDAALGALGVRRDDVMEVPVLHTEAFVLDMRKPPAMLLAEQTLRQRAHFARPDIISTDPRVKGHAGDRAIATVLAWAMRMRTEPAPATLAFPVGPPPWEYERGVTLLCQSAP